MGSDCDGSITVPAGAGTYYVKVKAGDNVGYYTNPIASTAVIVDNTAPSTSDNTGFGGQSYLGSKTFTLTPNDGGGSGIADTKYCVAEYPATCVPDTSGTSVTVTCPGVASCLKWIFYQSTDNAGNEQGWGSHSYSFTIINDTTPPTTTDNIDGNWHNSNVTVNLTCNDTGGSNCTTTYYTTDGSDPDTSSSHGNSFTLSTNGTYTIKYFSVDGAGNQETPVTANQVKIDKTNPTASITSPATGSALKETVTITATAADLGGSNIAKVEFLHSTTTAIKIGEGTETSPGTYSIDWNTKDPLVGALDGSRTIWVIAYDNAGNQFASTSTSVTVDNTPPTTTPSVYSVSYTWGAWTNGQKTIILTCNDGSGSGCANKYYCVDSTNSCTPTTLYSGMFNVNTEGTNYVRFYSTDTAGNSETVKSVSVLIDLTKPITNDNYGTKDGVWQNSDQTITLTASDSGGSGLQWTKYCFGTTLNNGVACYPETTGLECSDPASCNINITNEGSEYITYVSQDFATNRGNYVTRLIKIDKTAPTITITNPNTNPAQSKTVTAVTDEGTLTMSVNAVGVSTCNDSLTFVSYTSTTFNSETENTKTVCYRAVDDAGNATYSVSNPITGIDVTPPPVPSILDMQSAYDSGSLNNDNITNLNPIFDVNGVANSDYYRVYWWVDNSYWGILSDNNPGTQKTWNVSQFGADWTYRLALTAFDSLGNESAISASLDFTIDVNAPTTAEITAPQNNETIKGTYTITANASGDYSGIDRVEFWHENVPTLICSDNDPSDGFSCSWDSTLIADGAHQLYIIAYDKAGNQLESTRVNVSVDNTPPTVTELGDGTYHYQLPFLQEGLYGVTMLFSEKLSADGRTAVENALTAGANKILTFKWNDNNGGDGSKLRISVLGSETATFANNVVADVTDQAGNTNPNLLLINSDNIAPDLVSARTITTTTIDVTFSEDLQGDELTTGDFAVDNGGNPITVSSVSENNGVVTLTLENSMTADSTPTVTINPEVPQSIKDLAGNEQLTQLSVLASDGIAPTTPTANPVGDDYNSDQTVTLAAETGTEIRYTTNGTEPTNSTGTVYTKPILIGVDTVLKAAAIDSAGNISSVMTETYGIAPIISSEGSVSVSETSATITWTTDDLSTSRVIYDTVSHPTLDIAPNYGYVNSTIEDSTKVTPHSVDLTGLSSGITYYYRVISHGSPEAVGSEKSFVTSNPPSNQGGPGDGRSDGLGCASRDCGGTSTSQEQVLGASTGSTVPGVGQEVLSAQQGQDEQALGTESGRPTPTVSPTQLGQNPISNSTNWFLGHKKISLIFLLVIFAVIAYFLYRKKRQK